MDEKTQELRDIFTKVTDETTVTERQADTHGTLATDVDVDDRLADIVADMRDDLDFATSLDTEAFARIVRRFYADDTDAAIARDLDISAKKVARARLDLHLLRDSDTDAPVDLDALRDALDADTSLTDIADDLGVSTSTVRRYRRVLDAQQEINRVNDRYRSEFRNLLADRELATRLTEDVHEDGLTDATAGQETNTQM